MPMHAYNPVKQRRERLDVPGYFISGNQALAQAHETKKTWTTITSIKLSEQAKYVIRRLAWQMCNPQTVLPAFFSPSDTDVETTGQLLGSGATLPFKSLAALLGAEQKAKILRLHVPESQGADTEPAPPFTDLAVVSLFDHLRLGPHDPYVIPSMASSNGSIIGMLTIWKVGLNYYTDFKTTKLGIYLAEIWKQFQKNNAVLGHVNVLTRAVLSMVNQINKNGETVTMGTVRDGNINMPWIPTQTTISPLLFKGKKTDVFEPVGIYPDLILHVGTRILVVELKTVNVEPQKYNATERRNHEFQAFMGGFAVFTERASAISQVSPVPPQVYAGLAVSQISGRNFKQSTKLWKFTPGGPEHKTILEAVADGVGQSGCRWCLVDRQDPVQQLPRFNARGTAVPFLKYQLGA